MQAIPSATPDSTTGQSEADWWQVNPGFFAVRQELF
jgi:hypothetical protein